MMHVSKNLKHHLVTLDCYSIESQFENPVAIVDSILSSVDIHEALISAKELYSVLELRAVYTREVKAVICAKIAGKLYEVNFSDDALLWINKAISQDERRLMFYYNKAVILLKLSNYQDALSVIGFVRHNKYALLDVDNNLYSQLMNIGLELARKFQNIPLMALFKR